MVVASTRRLPSTTIEWAVWACAMPAGRTADNEFNITPARTKPRKASPRKNCAPRVIRNAPFFPFLPPQRDRRNPKDPASTGFQLTCKPAPSRSFAFLQQRCRWTTSRCGPVQNVIVGCKDHQHDNYREPDPEANFLRPFRQRSASNRFNCIEQKVAAIEQRNRQQVNQTDPYGQQH